MQHRVTVTAALLLSLAFLIAPSAAWAEDLQITPSSYDFGDVEVGESAVQTFDLASIGESDVWIYVVEISADGTATLICGEDIECDYAITRISGPIPYEYPPGMAIEVDVTFTPSVEGDSLVYLYVFSNDAVPDPGEPAPEPQAFIPLTGTGVVTPPPDDAAALMDELLEAFDASVDAGDIWGIGPGRSARNRLAAFRAHLLAADWLIDEGAGEWACVPLAAARAKADGANRPPDFVAGDPDAMADLLALIDEVMDALGCPDGGCHH